ncbi:hypothetical protein BT69DRAFT_1340163 [Atractiella rhizophila]|nr:hypothetical protein BT69DRAFT_1340163 [Atractiella rhizophila]
MPLHRLHISGISHTTTAQELESRFSSFGKVLPDSIAALGTKDGNDKPRKFAFLTLDCTEENLKRCFSLLSGSKYKGETLRISLAKHPDFQEKLQREREDAENHKSKKRKRKLLKGTEGKEVHMDALTTKDNYSSRHGWIAHPRRANSPIFPIVARPDRPIQPPKPSKPSSSSSNKQPVKILPHVRLNPLAYPSRKHLREKELKYGRDRVIAGRDRGDWECEVDAQKGEIRWQKLGGEDAEVWDFDGRSARLRQHRTKVEEDDDAASSTSFAAADRPGSDAEENVDRNDLLVRTVKEKELQERIMKSLGLGIFEAPQTDESGERGKRARELMTMDAQTAASSVVSNGYQPVGRWMVEDSDEEEDEEAAAPTSHDTSTKKADHAEFNSSSSSSSNSNSGEEGADAMDVEEIKEQASSVEVAKVSVPKLKDIFKPQEGFSFSFSSLIPTELLDPVESALPIAEQTEHHVPIPPRPIHPSRQPQLFFPVPRSSKGTQVLESWGLTTPQTDALRLRAESGTGWLSLASKWKRTETSLGYYPREARREEDEADRTCEKAAQRS